MALAEDLIMYPLIAAAEVGDLTIVESLLGQGANKNETTNKGRTAMWYAASNGHLEIMRLLVRKPTNKE